MHGHGDLWLWDGLHWWWYGVSVGGGCPAKIALGYDTLYTRYLASVASPVTDHCDDPR